MPLSLDERDIKILCQLQKDARISPAKLSRLVHLSRTATISRIKNLETNGYIKNYTTILNKSRFDKNLESIIGISLKSNAQDAIKIFLNEIKRCPQVTNCYRVNSCFDFFLHIAVTNLKEYQDYLTHTLSQIESVSAIQTFVVLEESCWNQDMDLSHLCRPLSLL